MPVLLGLSLDGSVSHPMPVSAPQHVRVVRKRRLPILLPKRGDQFCLDLYGHPAGCFLPCDLEQVRARKLPDQTSGPVPDGLARTDVGELPDPAAKLISLPDVDDLRVRHPVRLERCNSNSWVFTFEPARWARVGEGGRRRTFV